MNNNCALTKYQFFLTFVFAAHLVLGAYSFVEILISWQNRCWQTMSFLFLVTSIAQLLTILLVFKLKKTNLHDPAIRIKYKYILASLSLPVLINMLMSVLWWSQSDQNPVYCSFVSQLNLSPKFGIMYQFYSLFLGIIYVSALRAYTKRKFYLIAIGGPQNQIVQDINARNIRLNNLLAQLNRQLQQQQQNYQNFEDEHPAFKSQPYLQKQGQNIQCYICLASFKDEKDIQVIRTVCGHIFHSECAKQWLSSDHHQCPTCRRVLF